MAAFVGNKRQSTGYFLIFLLCFFCTANPIEAGNIPEPSDDFEMIKNGDFEAGNTDFKTDYVYSPSDISSEGFYAIVTNPQAIHATLSDCSDHTSGAGNMLAVNGSFYRNQLVWSQKVSGLIPLKKYRFSFWHTSVYEENPATLEVYFGDEKIDADIQLDTTACNWTEFEIEWISPGLESVDIKIIDNNLELKGNDFALDDISLKPACLLTSYTSGTVSICRDDSTEVFAAVPSGILPYKFEWFENNGDVMGTDSTVVIGGNENKVIYVLVQDSLGCSLLDSVVIDVVPGPETEIFAENIPLCPCSSARLYVDPEPGIEYKWDNGSEENEIMVDSPGTYRIYSTNSLGCTSADSIVVSGADIYSAISIDTLSVPVDTILIIDVSIDQYGLADCGINSGRVILGFNKSMLFPLSGFDANYIRNDTNFISIDFNPADSIIGRPEFRTLLGNESCTEISIECEWDCSEYSSNFSKGMICLSDLCIDPIPRLFDDSFPAGIISINPNPVSNEKMEIVINNPEDSDFALMIYDQTGRLVNKSKSSLRGEGIKIKIDTKSFSNGIYFIRFVSYSSIYSSKFVIFR